MVHVATLVHDDVLDEADERRYSESINSRWNNTTSILTGDFLFAKAFEVGCMSGSVEVMRQIAVASCNVCKGELSQNALAGDFEIGQQKYYEIISLKTAELCRCACALGALLSECDEASIRNFEAYGLDLGIAFQVIDDVLDIVGEKDEVGKTLGTDLKNQKCTLPILHCLKVLPAERSGPWVEKLTGDDWELDEVVDLLNSTGSIEYARQAARNRAGHALEFAKSLSKSAYSDSLVTMAEFVIDRTY